MGFCCGTEIACAHMYMAASGRAYPAAVGCDDAAHCGQLGPIFWPVEQHWRDDLASSHRRVALESPALPQPRPCLPLGPVIAHLDRLADKPGLIELPRDSLALDPVVAIELDLYAKTAPTRCRRPPSHTAFGMELDGWLAGTYTLLGSIVGSLKGRHVCSVEHLPWGLGERFRLEALDGLLPNRGHSHCLQCTLASPPRDVGRDTGNRSQHMSTGASSRELRARALNLGPAHRYLAAGRVAGETYRSRYQARAVVWLCCQR